MPSVQECIQGTMATDRIMQYSSMHSLAGHTVHIVRLAIPVLSAF